MFKTRITEMLGIDYPIIKGGMQWLSRAELVAAVANAGGFGFITSASFSSADELRDEIRKTKSLTDKPFGVNINLFPTTRPYKIEDFVSVVVEEGIPAVETSGRSPEPYMEQLKKGNVKVIHKVAGVRFAKTAQRVGADAVAIVGFECGGHPGMDDVGSLVLVPATVDAVDIPVIAAGGFADARGFMAALALGAEAILMGTRFMVTKECLAHSNTKEALVKLTETDTMMIERSIRSASRVIKNQPAEQVLEMESRGASLEELMPLISGEQGSRLLQEGDMNAGTLSCGQCIGLIHEVLSVKEVIDGIINGAREIQKRICAA